ncbi:hypothetical protein [Reichenbachiella sp. MALMAid0571]|uniref:hypothetical protein n=1 Tax=Reichenbachiella sp. MALMAid0571 TaxID=3143939 RepID=UPI0032DFF2BE
MSSPGMGKRFKIYEGDEIKFRLEGEKYFNVETIKKLNGDSVFLQNSVVNIKDISVVDIRKYNQHRMNPDVLAGASVLAGAGYFIVDQFNHTVVKQRGWNVNGKVVRTSAILIGVGIIIHKTKRRYFKVNKKNKISIVTF